MRRLRLSRSRLLATTAAVDGTTQAASADERRAASAVIRTEAMGRWPESGGTATSRRQDGQANCDCPCSAARVSASIGVVQCGQLVLMAGFQQAAGEAGLGVERGWHGRKSPRRGRPAGRGGLPQMPVRDQRLDDRETEGKESDGR